MKQKTEDYKLTAVRYYINNDDGYDKTCNIFDCKKSSLKRWVQQYKTRKSLIRKPKKAISYKIKKDEVKTALYFLDKTEQLTMNELSMLVKEKHKDFDISPQHLGRIMRYLVDEFRSSCKCSKCNGGECSKFLMVDNPKPYRNNQQLVWGLLRCKSCNGFWNRDCNGAKNIYKIARNAVNKIARPDYLCRTTFQAIFKNGYNQNLHGDEKTRP